MRGRRHTLTLVGQRGATGTSTGTVVRDSEGRWHSPAGTEGTVSNVVVKGFIGPMKVAEVPQGLDADAAAQVPRGTAWARGDDLIAAGTDDPLLDGRYEIVGYQAGGAADILRLFLKRYTPPTTP